MIYFYREFGTAPITKNGDSHSFPHNYIKGRIPITKNIVVVDGDGNEYGATYLKRAKGLIKKGRARFIDDNTICLACPPNILEDNEMEENNIGVNPEERGIGAESKLTVEDILSRIDKIISDNAHIRQAIESIKLMEGYESKPGAQEDTRPKAISELIAAREVTNQQTLRLLQSMYDDVRLSQNGRGNRGGETFKLVADALVQLDIDEEYVADILKMVAQHTIIK